MTTLFQIHFINSVRYHPNTFSCSVDCFLEIVSNVFMPYLQGIPKTDVLNLIYNSGLQYERIKNQSEISVDIHQLLNDIREPVWIYLRACCNSLQAMDCNAQFSEIFQSKTFGQLNDYEKKLFVNTYRFETVCNKCDNNLTTDSDIFVQYVTLSDVRQSTIDNNWPQYITWTNSSSGKLQCPNCESSSDIPIASLLSPAEILFVKFASDAVDNLLFYEDIDILSLPYQLKGLVRCKSNHFTCATMKGGD